MHIFGCLMFILKLCRFMDCLHHKFPLMYYPSGHHFIGLLDIRKRYWREVLNGNLIFLQSNNVHNYWRCTLTTVSIADYLNRTTGTLCYEEVYRFCVHPTCTHFINIFYTFSLSRVHLRVHLRYCDP